MINSLLINSLPTGLMVTASTLYHALNFLNITIDIRNVCVFLAPLFSSLTVLVVYLLTKEVQVRELEKSMDVNISVKLCNDLRVYS